jgi:nucleotide-binding universal stress UspA family protein
MIEMHPSNRAVRRYRTSRREGQIIRGFAVYSKILVPVDGSDTSTAGLVEAIKIAKAQGSQLRLVHIVNEFILDYTYSPGIYANDLIESLRKAGQALLDREQALVRCSGITPECVLIESIGGAAADLILAQAQEWHADLIIMGTHGRRGLARLALGSDAEQVVRAAAVPVMLVRGTPKQEKKPATATLVRTAVA